MNKVTSLIKRAPRWAWWTTGGLVIGVVALKVYGNRDSEPGGTTATDGSTVGDTESGSTQPATTGSSPPGVIVPPIITGGDGAGVADVTGAIGGMFGGFLTDMTQLLGTVVTGDQAILAGVVAGDQERSNHVIDLLAGAGSAPQPAIINPTVVITQKPPAAKPAAHGGAQQYPTWNGHTLWWWQQAGNAKRNGKWRWPVGQTRYVHSRAFEGNAAAEGHTTNPHG